MKEEKNRQVFIFFCPEEVAEKLVKMAKAGRTMTLETLLNCMREYETQGLAHEVQDYNNLEADTRVYLAKGWTHVDLIPENWGLNLHRLRENGARIVSFGKE